MENKTNLRAALYARESPSLAENELTIKSQVEAVEERIKSDGNILVSKYEDNGYAGDLLIRPSLDQARDDATQHKFDLFYIHDRDRLARLYWLQELVLDEMEKLGIQVVFLEEKRAETPEEKVLQGVRGIFAEYERAKIRERTRRGRLLRAKKGMLVGHEAPYGYKYVRPDKDKEERWLEIDKEEAKVIKKIFGWLAYEGSSLRGVVKNLYDQNIKTRDGQSIWAFSTLGRLVRNETYIGITYYNKTQSLEPVNPGNNGYKRMKKTSRKYKPKEDWFPIKVPSILDKKTFLLAQKQLDKNTYLTKRETKYKYLLRSLLLDECGSHFAGDGMGHDGVLRYRCTNRLRKFPLKRTCKSLSIRADEIEAKVWEKITTLLSNPKLITKQIQRRSKEVENKVSVIESQIQEIRLSRSRLVDQEIRIQTAYQEGVLSLEQLRERLKDLKEKDESFNEMLETLEANKSSSYTVTQITSAEEFCRKVSDCLSKLDVEKKERLLHLLVTEIKIKDNQAILRGVIPTDINSEETNNYVSESLLGGSDRFGGGSNNGRGGYQRASSPRLYNCWASR